MTEVEGGEHRTLVVGAAATDTSSVALARNCEHVQVYVEGADVRLTVNGTAPVAGTIGEPQFEASSLIMSRAEWDAAKWIREDATDATLQIMQYN